VFHYLRSLFNNHLRLEAWDKALLAGLTYSFEICHPPTKVARSPFLRTALSALSLLFRAGDHLPLWGQAWRSVQLIGIVTQKLQWGAKAQAILQIALLSIQQWICTMVLLASHCASASQQPLQLTQLKQVSTQPQQFLTTLRSKSQKKLRWQCGVK